MEEIREIVIFTAHNYIRELVGEMVHTALIVILILIGLLLLVGAISNSNILLGDPQKRDKSQLGEVEYRKTRTILRVVLSVVGAVLIVYNTIGLMI